jgi:hypothetical protein
LQHLGDTYVKAARVYLDMRLLQQALGLPVPWTIAQAHVLHTHGGRSALELIITGDTLDDAFDVQKGLPIPEGELVVTFEQRTAQILVVDACERTRRDIL